MEGLTKDCSNCFIANFMGNSIRTASQFPWQITEKMFLPQTFEIQRLFNERKQLNKSCQDAFLSCETQGLFDSSLANDLVYEFENTYFKAIQHAEPQESKLDVVPENSVNVKFLSNAANTAIPHVPGASNRILSLKLLKEPIAPSLPVRIEPIPLISHWLDWKKVLNDWLEPSCVKALLTNNKLPIGEVQPVTSKGLEENFEEKIAQECLKRDTYLDTWCKCYMKNYVSINGSQRALKSTWWLHELDIISPFHKFQDYKFKIKEAEMDSFKAVCEGCIAFDNGYMERAIQCFENVLLQEEDSLSSWYYLGLAQAAIGNDNQAICAFKRCLTLNFSQHDIYLELASSFMNEGLHSSACQMLCIWLCMHKADKATHKMIIKQKFGFFSLNEMPKSFVDESDLVKLLNIFNIVAESKSEMLDEEETKELMKKSSEKFLSKDSELFHGEKYDLINSKFTKDPDLNTCFALLFIMSNRFKAAYYCLLTAIQVKTKAPKLWNMLGAVLVQEKKYGEATEAFKRALDIWPGYTKVRINIASMCRRLGLYRDAAQHLLHVFLQEEGNFIMSTSWQELKKVILEINDPILLDAWYKRDLVHLKENLLM